MDELFGLLMVRRHHREDDYDALIVDAAPTGETLKLLSLPDQMSWYVEKIFPIQRRAAKLVRPLANRARSLPRSEEHTSELQSRQYLVCRLLLEKKKIKESITKCW